MSLMAKWDFDGNLLDTSGSEWPMTANGAVSYDNGSLLIPLGVQVDSPSIRLDGNPFSLIYDFFVESIAAMTLGSIYLGPDDNLSLCFADDGRIEILRSGVLITPAGSVSLGNNRIVITNTHLYLNGTPVSWVGGNFPYIKVSLDINSGLAANIQGIRLYDENLPNGEEPAPVVTVVESPTTFFSNAVLNENGSSVVVDQNGVVDYVVGKKQKVIIAVNFPKNFLDNSGTGVFSVSRLKSNGEITAMSQVVDAAIDKYKDYDTKFAMLYLKKALNGCTADALDIMFLKDVNSDPLSNTELSSIVKLLLTSSANYFGIVVGALPDGKNILSLLSDASYREIIANRINGYILKTTFNPFDWKEINAACVADDKYFSVVGENINEKIMSDVYGLEGMSLREFYQREVPVHLIDKKTFLNKRSDKVLFENLKKKRVSDAANVTKELELEGKVKDITVFMPSMTVTKRELERINSGNRDFNFNMLVSGIGEGDNSYGRCYNSNAEGFAFFDVAQQPGDPTSYWDRLVLNVAEGKYACIDDATINAYTTAIARKLKGDGMKIRFYESSLLADDLETPNWGIDKRVVINPTKQPSMDYLMNDIVINGKLNSTDLTEIVVGANFSYDLAMVIKNFYEADKVNDASVKNDFKLRILATLTSMVKNGILSQGSEISADVIEERGNYTIVARAIDADTNKEYSLTLDITRKPALDNIGTVLNRPTGDGGLTPPFGDGDEV